MENKSFETTPSTLEVGDKFLLRQYDQGQFSPAAVIDKTESADGTATVHVTYYDGSAMQMTSLTDSASGVSVIKESPIIDELISEIRGRIDQETVNYRSAIERNERTLSMVAKYFG